MKFYSDAFTLELEKADASFLYTALLIAQRALLGQDAKDHWWRTSERARLNDWLEQMRESGVEQMD